MGWYIVDEADVYAEDQTDASRFRRFSSWGIDQPRRSPIRRKNKLRLEEGFKPKAKRNFKKIQNKIKYDWQGG